MVQFSHLRAQMKAQGGAETLRADNPKARAMLMPAMFVSMADGDVDRAEVETFAAIAQEHPGLEVAATDVLPVMQALAAEITTGDAMEMVAEAAALLDPHARVQAISFAIRVAVADANFDAEEQGTLRALATNFGLDRATYDALLQDHLGPKDGPLH